MGPGNFSQCAFIAASLVAAEVVSLKFLNSTLFVGQKISGTGIPAGATISTIVTVGSSNNGTITISSNSETESDSFLKDLNDTISSKQMKIHFTGTSVSCFS